MHLPALAHVEHVFERGSLTVDGRRRDLLGAVLLVFLHPNRGDDHQIHRAKKSPNVPVHLFVPFPGPFMRPGVSEIPLSQFRQRMVHRHGVNVNATLRL